MKLQSMLILFIGLLLSPFCCMVQAADRILQDCADCPVMVAIPAGKFMMGEADNPSTMPVHQVKLNYSFAIGQTEVTEAQFRFFLQRTGYNAGPSHLTTPFSSTQPAVDVDWYAASAYALWLSRHTGHRYRLPSEAEWDYAAHAGNATRYWWGNSTADGCGKEHLPITFFPYDQPCASAQPQDTIDVASLIANPWGLYDMEGNVGEWMLDCPPVEASAYAGAPDDGAPFMGCSQYSISRVVRGPSFLASTTPRRLSDPSEHTSNTGFRVVRELP